MSVQISKDQAKRIWIRAQKLDQASPFGEGPSAVRSAVEHLGYVQIDTINVIERCHHHILFNRIPKYKRSDLHHCQTIDKTVFEYWTHALSFVPGKDFRFFMGQMKRTKQSPNSWFQKVKKEEIQKVLKLLKTEGALSIRDINDDILVEKEHEWASRKPSKKALQFLFYCGEVVVSERMGMLKKYELTSRHFDWKSKPKPVSEKEFYRYLLERSLRSQGIVSLDSICHLSPSRKPAIRKLIEADVKKGELIPVQIEGLSKIESWIRPQDFEKPLEKESELIHLLSPFDPLVIQRKRLHAYFEYDHKFEAYVPKEKRKFGYFALPVLAENQIVAAIDLKTDRQQKKLLIQKWTWLGRSKSAKLKERIESELNRFEKFQLEP